MAQVNAGRVRFVSRGSYDNSTQYYTFDFVSYNGNCYYAKESTIGNLPTDTNKWQLVATKGSQGDVGPTGNGISTITKTSTSGLVDTYTILYTNGNTTTFDVTNGQDGNITDVQLDGTSIVNNGVANALTTGYSTDNKLITEKDYNRAMSIYNVLPKVNGTGENISLDNTGVAPLNMELKGNTSQETTSISSGDEYDSPSPDHPQPIHVVSGDNSVVVCGKNIFNPILLSQESGYNSYNSTTGLWTTSSLQYNYRSIFYAAIGGARGRDISKLLFLPVPGTYAVKFYNLTNNTTSSITFASYDNNGDKIKDEAYLLQTDTSNTITFTIDTPRYLDIQRSANSGDLSFSYIQIEKGTTATTYTPYQSQTYPINLGTLELCKIGTYQDKFFKAIDGNTIYDNLDSTIKNTLDYGEWYLKKNIGKVVLTGDENTWSKQTGYYQCSTYLGGVGGYGICNYYTYGSGTNTFWLTANAFRTNDSTDTLEHYLTWVREHNIIFYQPLGTSTYTKIEGTLASQLEDIKYALSKKTQTNISQINNDLPFIIDAETLRDISEWSE